MHIIDPSANPPLQTHPVMRVAIYSLLFNLALAGIKFFLFAISGSQALQADSVHTLVDVLASIALILGLKISEKRSLSFPLGLYKVENFASIAISVLLFLTAYEIILQAILGQAEPIDCPGFVLYVVAAIIPLPYLFGRYQTRARTLEELVDDQMEENTQIQ